jgi:hypothetical protein
VTNTKVSVQPALQTHTSSVTLQRRLASERAADHVLQHLASGGLQNRLRVGGVPTTFETRFMIYSTAVTKAQCC